MKSLKISLVLIFALFLCASCTGDGKETDTNTRHDVENGTEDTRADDDTDYGADSDTDTEMAERSVRMDTEAPDSRYLF